MHGVFFCIDLCENHLNINDSALCAISWLFQILHLQFIKYLIGKERSFSQNSIRFSFALCRLEHHPPLPPHHIDIHRIRTFTDGINANLLNLMEKIMILMCLMVKEFFWTLFFQGLCIVLILPFPPPSPSTPLY